MLYTKKFKMKTKPKNISTTARIAMPVKDLSTGKYLKFGYINLLSFWEKGRKSPTRKVVQIKLEVDGRQIQIMPKLYDLVKLMKIQPTYAKFNSRKKTRLKIMDKDTWDYWLKLRKRQEEKLKRNNK